MKRKHSTSNNENALIPKHHVRKTQNNKETNALGVPTVPTVPTTIPYDVVKLLNNAEVRKRLAISSHDLAVKVLQSTNSMKQYERDAYLGKLGAVIKKVPLSNVEYTKGNLLSETVTLTIPLPEYFGQRLTFSCTIQRHFESGELNVIDVKLTKTSQELYALPYIHVTPTYHIYTNDPTITGTVFYDMLQIIKTLVQYLPSQVHKYFSRRNDSLDLRRLIAAIDDKLANLSVNHKNRLKHEVWNKSNSQAKVAKANAMTMNHANAVAKEKAKASYPQWTRNSAAYGSIYSSTGPIHPYMTRSNARHITNATYKTPMTPMTPMTHYPTTSYHPTHPSTSYHPTMPMYMPTDPKFHGTSHL